MGLKWQAVKQSRWLPAHTIVVSAQFRMARGDVYRRGVIPDATWVYGWQATKWLVVRGSTGVGLVLPYDQPRDTNNEVLLANPGAPARTLDFHQSLVSYQQWTKRIGSYTEWFAFFDYGAERAAQHNAGAGLYFYLTPDIQFDLRGGTTLFGGSKEWFVGTGFSIRGKYLAPNAAQH